MVLPQEREGVDHVVINHLDIGPNPNRGLLYLFTQTREESHEFVEGGLGEFEKPGDGLFYRLPIFDDYHAGRDH